MPVYRLGRELVFPHPELADREGILAVGGDLKSDRLILAYSNGIFPWYSEGQPILWWSPNPRFVLFPNDIRVSGSMKKVLKKAAYTVTFDRCFRDVISYCRSLREGETWITDEMTESYCRLHSMGLAHSVETWCDGRLVGGLYGVSLGKCFFGESMFSLMDNASKTALIMLAQKLMERDFVMIDSQVYTKHLESMGAVNVPRREFLRLLQTALEYDTILGSWSRF
ncbi:leucyl/phenylalanyl-tRNA--protein transferase [Anaerobacterium chartisolvens]|uniref:Leucyl/phenylalanyl-tRNA--protein transferase n=1 Tax=Anaerobacterium chartisolvens TaxID=1297424 RepID=A0A369B7T8_9FIRM|nr:leucyl/phenylalanyl-tRNA--protein transferase [Anaerobacterium chartisolvens]RCX17491.1 leucyl/phenylalanyl-tRNA--protein transferase [Anaerobacterium chartisolvens]